MIKENMKFRQFLCQSSENILAESILLSVAHNVKKLYNIIQIGKLRTCLYDIKQVS